MSHGLATLHEMQTVYSLEDAYDMAEIIAVDAHNQRAWSAWSKQR